MNLTYYPYEPFSIKSDKPTVIETSNHEIYQKLIQSFNDFDSAIKFSTDNFELVEVSKALRWFGDAFMQVDLDKEFQANIYKQIQNDITDDQQQEIYNLVQQLKNKVTEITYMFDLPLEVEENFEMSKIIKLCNVHFDTQVKTSPYGIIETILKTANELNETRILGFKNITDYLSDSELQEIFALSKTLNLRILLIKFSENQRTEIFKDCRYYYLDEDYVEWRND